MKAVDFVACDRDMYARFAVGAVGQGDEAFAFEETGSVVEFDYVEVVGAAKGFDVEIELAVLT